MNRDDAAHRRGGRVLLGLAAPALLAGCGEGAGQRDQSPSQGETQPAPSLGEQSDDVADPARQAPLPSPRAGARRTSLPSSLTGKFAETVAQCASYYGPITVTNSAIDFGWGRATFRSVAQDGAGYRIEADLVSEGRIDATPQRVTYGLAARRGDAGVRFTNSRGTRDYGPCPDGDAETAAQPEAGTNEGWRRARCVVESTGQPTYRGACLFSEERGGTFSIRRANDGLIAGRRLITVALVGDGAAEVSGLTPSGNVSRWGRANRAADDRACWRGTDFRVCAY